MLKQNKYDENPIQLQVIKKEKVNNLNCHLN